MPDGTTHGPDIDLGAKEKPNSPALNKFFAEYQANPIRSKEADEVRAEFMPTADAVVAEFAFMHPNLKFVVGLAGSAAHGISVDRDDVDPVYFVETENGDPAYSEENPQIALEIRQLAKRFNSGQVTSFDISEIKKIFGPDEHLIPAAFPRLDESGYANWDPYWYRGSESFQEEGFLIENRLRVFPFHFRVAALFSPTTPAQEASGIPNQMRKEVLETFARRPDGEEMWRMTQMCWNLNYMTPDIREFYEDIPKDYRGRLIQVLKNRLAQRGSKRFEESENKNFYAFQVGHRLSKARQRFTLPPLQTLLSEFKVTTQTTLPEL